MRRQCGAFTRLQTFIFAVKSISFKGIGYKMNIVLKKIIQQLLKGFYSLNDLENPEFAEALAKVKKKHPQTSAPPKLFTKSLEVEKCTVADGVYYRANDKKNKSNKKVMFIHGGGLVEQAMPMHWIMCKDLAKDTGCEIIFPEYPLVPESNSETAHRMIVDVYKEVLKTCKPEDLTLIGDSAGGTLAQLK